MLFPMRSLIGFLAFNVKIITAALVDISATVKASAAHKTLDSALAKAKFHTVLAGTGPFTLFAPTNVAFEALPKGTLDNLLLPANLHKLKNVLNYHVVSGKKATSDLKDGEELTTVLTQQIKVKIATDKTVTVNGAKVSTKDKDASNGVIHFIDKVLIPSTILEMTTSLKKLVEALTSADLVTTLKGDGPFTVLAPTDAAFNALPSGELTRLLKAANKVELQSLLKYHVVGSLIKAVTNDQKITTLQGGVITAKVVGSAVTIEGAKVTTTEQALNGIVHIVDKVLIPTKAKVTTGKNKSSNSTTSDSITNGMVSVSMVALGLHAIL